MRNGRSLALGLLVSIHLCLPAVGEGKSIVVVLRYDDYSSRPERREFDRALVRTLSQLDVPCTFGVIPYACAGDERDPNKQPLIPLKAAEVEILQDLVGAEQIEVAQHGYSHQTITAGGRPSEFVGMSMADQLQTIRRGKRHLESLLQREVTTFIPPWNSYDSDTVEALSHCGFRTLSAAPGGITGTSDAAPSSD